MATPKKYQSFEEFYPFYLSQHQNKICRGLHYIGSAVALALLALAFVKQTWWLVLLALVSGYAFAWVGHFFFEKNRPATFTYPWYSFIGDWRMLKEFLTNRQSPKQ
ncbi:DUF962 domain-containing protein [Thalassotalea euphylliae]|uniref:DUF962 domain-containing protein n=1 Tax=Thalassotalea euphylliae TaxID=1655234 RepID=A0A3E0TZ09_9GAMM|nr:DUF962 domain-containing protein [Thalassotalea euphylliae]REL29868.1 DUF962 domain-containing protein [Thalassotalea euphylliae]